MEYINIKGAREHNLKNIDVTIPKNSLTVVTGVSGSGKSTLAFDTIYAEGQRRYVESLSNYAKQFLGLMPKPRVDEITGLCPAISIEQKTTSNNPRSTVGTSTEIYDYIRVFYATVGKVSCIECNGLLSRKSVDQIVQDLKSLELHTKFQIVVPYYLDSLKLQNFAIQKDKAGLIQYVQAQVEEIRQKGFERIAINDVEYMLSLDDVDSVIEKVCVEYLKNVKEKKKEKDSSKESCSCSCDKENGSSCSSCSNIYKQDIQIMVIVNRMKVRDDKEYVVSLSESIQKANTLQDNGIIVFEIFSIDDLGALYKKEELVYTTKYICPKHPFASQITDVNPRLFSFNQPAGACPRCGGLGNVMAVDLDLLIPDRELTLANGIKYIALSSTKKNETIKKMYYDPVAKHYGVKIDGVKIKDLPDWFLEKILYGTKEPIEFDYKIGTISRKYVAPFEGICNILQRRYKDAKESMIKFYQKMMKETVCVSCKGKRLNDTVLKIQVDGKSIYDLCNMNIQSMYEFFSNVDKILTEEEMVLVKEVVKEIQTRLLFLINVGLSYLNLTRTSSTLSGGEAQRIRLASCIGTGLTGVLYVLDEPSIGLHQKDNDALIHTMKQLRDLGNTLIVVEHDFDTMQNADWIVDIGKDAGRFGGNVVYQGPVADIGNAPDSLTGEYITGRMEIPLKDKKDVCSGNGKKIQVKKASQNNLKNVSVDIPLGKFVVVTGVSGSGKSSLVNEVIFKNIHNMIGKSIIPNAGAVGKITGVENIKRIIDIDQSPIGRTPRSNPATYTGVFDYIREIFSQVPTSKIRGYKAGRFSFNVKGGRCENCQGDGVIKKEMQFLNDVYVTCPVCNGKRYNNQTLDVKYKEKNIYDVLEMPVEQACELFANVPKIHKKLQVLKDVGLGYIKLGQSSTTLSGGEAQRVKLATELSKNDKSGTTLYVLDEPTTGLHVDDIKKLVGILETLVANGNTVLCIEHNLDLIKRADWIIDIGKDGGDKGGNIVYKGTIEGIQKCKDSYTGIYLKKYIQDQKALEKKVKKEGLQSVKK